MGRKRNADAQEDKAKIGCSETTLSKEKTGNANPMVAKNVENVHNVKKSPNAKKGSKVTELAIRRSIRINSSGNLRVRPIVEHVNLVENEQEGVNSSPLMKEKDSEREPQAQQANTPEMNGKSLEEKVDYLIRTADEMKSKFVRQAFGRTNESPSDFSYKSLYFESQKKIEALVEEHYDLVRKLEFANGKIEAYESMKDVLSAQKGVILFSALAKDTEPIANKLPQPGPTCASPPPPPAATIPDASSPKRRKDYRKKQGTRLLGR